MSFIARIRIVLNVGGDEDQLGGLESSAQARDHRLARTYGVWRKPAGELLIVVAGVMLGLLATEWVSGRKARSDVRDAQKALERELSVNLYAVRYRQEIGPCARRRLADLRNWIAEQRAGRRSALPAEIGRPSSSVPITSVWEVAKAGQVAAKMALDDRLRFASLYDSLELFDEMLITERDIWFAIGDFAGVNNLPAFELARFNGLVGRAAAFDEAISGNADQMTMRFRELGIQPAKEVRPGLSARRAICQPFAKTGDASTEASTTSETP